MRASQQPSVTLLGCALILVATQISEARAENFYCAKPATNYCDPAALGSSQETKKIPGLWPTRTIGVVFAPNIKARDKLYAAIKQSFAEVHRVGGYNFYECDEGKVRKSFSYIYVDDVPQHGNHCNSKVGYRPPGSPPSWLTRVIGSDDDVYYNRLRISVGGKNCDETSGIYSIAHEILHRLGVQHEHTNPVASKYIKPKQAELDKHKWDYQGPQSGTVAALRFESTDFLAPKDPYDPVSVMHYSLKDFDQIPVEAGEASTPLQRFIERNYLSKDPQFYDGLIGKRICISSEDARFLQYLGTGVEPALPCDKFGVARTESCKVITGAGFVAEGASSDKTSKLSGKPRLGEHATRSRDKLSAQ
jgi:hypothetical protein